MIKVNGARKDILMDQAGNFLKDLCRIYKHEWYPHNDWTYCRRCNKKYKFEDDWEDIQYYLKILGS